MPSSTTAAETEQAVRAAFAQQSVWCRNLGAPFTSLLLATAGERLDDGTAVGQRILAWPGRPETSHDALALRFAGGLHALVRRGTLPALARLYPPHALPQAAELWAALSEALAEAADALMPWLDSAPQTNEVGRSVALWPGLMLIAHETGLKLALHELGSSAGLNLVLDRYEYRLGATRTGAIGSSLLLSPEWQGDDPIIAPVRIARRRGVDLNPLNAADPLDRARLLAYFWPEQTARSARAETALALAAADPPPIDTGDAADWTEATLDPAPETGVARVLMHSIAFQYFPEPTQARIRAHVLRLGARATAEAPFAWLRLEGNPHYDGRPSLQLTLYPGGTERVLGTASPHGIWVNWLGAGAPTPEGDGA